MEYTNKEFCIEVWGDYACFSRPEMKVERVSYDVMTPSAARAVFEAIFWKPAIRWHVKRIEVLNPVKWISVRRNEVGKLISPRSPHLFVEESRQQRAGLFLRDVHYRLTAEMEFIAPRDRSGETGDGAKASFPQENPGKYHAIFERRARKGQCFTAPYLGCREFSAGFRYVEDVSDPGLKAPVDETRDLGFMLYDLDFETNREVPPAMFFRAALKNGVVEVPSVNSGEVLR